MAARRIKHFSSIIIMLCASTTNLIITIWYLFVRLLCMQHIFYGLTNVVQVVGLARRGGQTVDEAVKRMMAALFTTDLCREMNWTGTTRDDDDDDDDNDGDSGQLEGKEEKDNENKKLAFRDSQCRLAMLSELGYYYQ